MSVTNQHRAGAEQEIDIFPAALVPHPAAPALADHYVRGEIAESAAGQHPLRLLNQPAPVLGLSRPVHWRPPRLAEPSCLVSASVRSRPERYTANDQLLVVRS